MSRSPATVLPEVIPPLRHGDRLTSEEFERRWEAMPHLKRAELLRGIVHRPPPPVHPEHHGGPHADLILWLGLFRIATPGGQVFDNSTLRLGPLNRPQPDAVLVVTGRGKGFPMMGPDGYLVGAPQLAAEVAASSARLDRGLKFDIYREQGISEYLIWFTLDRTIEWYRQSDEQYARLPPGEDGIIRSQVFPGLWLDPHALVSREMARVVDVARQGLDSAEYAAFRDGLDPGS